MLHFRVGIALLILEGCLLHAASAQETAPPIKPREPITLRAPEGAWRVTTKYKTIARTGEGDDADAVSTVVRDVWKKGNLIHETVRAGGRTYEIYVVGSLVITDYGKKGYATTVSPDNVRFLFYDACDFDRMRWVSGKNFTKAVDYKGTPALEFTVAGENKTLNPLQTAQLDYWKSQKSYDRPAFASDSVALLDVKNQLPLHYEDGEVEETYEYFPAPKEIQIPEAIQAELRNKLDFLQKTGQRLFN